MKRKALVLTSILASVLMANAAHQNKQAGRMPKHLPGGGVADGAGKVGYFPNPTGGIDALDLTTGKVLWTSKEASRPLLALNDRLVAQRTEKNKANQVRIVILDGAQAGKRVLESQPIVLPDWVSVEVAYGRSFRGSARAEAESLLLTWEARAFYAGGARPTPEIEAAARKEASGVARVDLANGKIEKLTADQIKAGKFFPIPGESIVTKVGNHTFALKDAPGNNPRNPLQRRRTLQALNDAKEVVWQHEIAAPVFLLPRP